MKLKLACLAVILLQGCSTISPEHCVYVWGGNIPKEKRTAENCRHGYSHWDVSGSGTASGARPDLPRSITTSGGNFAIIPNYSSGGVSAVIQTSRGARSR